MASSFFGFAMAMLVSACALWIIFWVTRLIFGKLGASLMLGLVTVLAVVAGLKALITSDNLALEMLGFSLSGLTVWLTLKGAQLGVRKLREMSEVGVDETV